MFACLIYLSHHQSQSLRKIPMCAMALTGELWNFEQKQGILYIHVPIRMTVYRMTTQRGLFVYAPVAPTAECLRLLRELEEEYGEVRHIVLPTVAVEHKPLSGSRTEQWFSKGLT